eukprot:5914191-Alexandrium_andersonii.AAC.1
MSVAVGPGLLTVGAAGPAGPPPPIQAISVSCLFDALTVAVAERLAPASFRGGVSATAAGGAPAQMPLPKAPPDACTTPATAKASAKAMPRVATAPSAPATGTANKMGPALAPPAAVPPIPEPAP